MQMSFYDPASGLMVFWSRKSACTAVAEWFARSVVGIAQGSPRDRLAERGFLHTASASLKIVPEVTRSIGFVRDPVQRVLSGYLNKFVLYRGKPIFAFDQLEPLSRRAYLQATGMTEQEAGRDYDGLSLMQILDYMEHFCNGPNEDGMDPHFSPQYALPFRRRAILPDEVHDVASLNEALGDINARLGFSGLPGRSNASPWGGLSRGDLTTVSSVELARMGEIAKTDLDTPAVRAAVARAHAVDYEAFGYSIQKGRPVASENA